MRLLGAKEFLKTVKPGTLFMEYWLERNQCDELIQDFESGMSFEDLSKKYGVTGFLVFGDNGGSMAFSENEEEVTIDGVTYNCLFYYDHNIVGDASPTETLNLVFDTEDEYPEEILVEGDNKLLSKKDIIRIRDYFVKENGPFDDETDLDKRWALKKIITDDYYKNDKIVNYKGERKWINR